MDLLKITKELCEAYDIKPARSKGQNFLIRESIYDKIIESSDLKKDNIVLEVGPGLGFLTAKLASKAKKVIAVELDDKLAETLKIGLTSQKIKNVEVLNEDIMKFEIRNWKFGNGNEGSLNIKSQISNFKIVANIPYNISSLLLRKFLSSEFKPSLMVLMLQKEVAERITAKAGEMSLLAVSVQFYAKPEIIEIIPANDFWPAPKVDSAIIKLKVKSPRPPLIKGVSKDFEKEFFRLVKIGFSARRKMLKNNLANGFHISNEEASEKLKNAGFSQNIRAQELSVEDWKKLLELFK